MDLKYRDEEIPIENITFDVIGGPDYVDSIYHIRMIVPIILGEFEDQQFLIAGNRRIASARAAYDRAVADGTLEQRPWLRTIPVRIWENINPTDRATISFIENERRSDNYVNTVLLIRAAQARGDWDLVRKASQFTRTDENKYRGLMELEPEWFDLYSQGKINQNVLIKAAGIGPARRKKFLESFSEHLKEEPEAKVTGSLLQAARRQEATAILGTAPLQIFKKVEAPAEAVVHDELVFLVAFGHMPEAEVYTDKTAAQARKQEVEGARLFQCIEL